METINLLIIALAVFFVSVVIIRLLETPEEIKKKRAAVRNFSIGVSLVFISGFCLGMIAFRDNKEKPKEIQNQEISQNKMSVYDCWEIQARKDTLLLIPKE